MGAEFEPLFDGHVASDDRFDLDEQIDAVFEAIEVSEGEWSVSIDTAAPQSRPGLCAMRDREVGILRATVATLTRLRMRRDAILAPALRDATEAALDAEAAK